MSAADSILALSRDPRLSPYAMSGVAAGLWAPDANRLLWTNASGAALLGAATPAALVERRFDAEEPLPAEILRVAATLPAGWPRLERLRAIGANFTANCSRVSQPASGILVIATDPTRPAMPLAERVERLFAPGSEAVAVFSAEGKLVYATGELDAETTLATLGVEGLKDAAIAEGRATGESAIGPLTLNRLGSGSTTVLVAMLPENTAAPADKPSGETGSTEEMPEPPEHTPTPTETASEAPASTHA